MTLRQRTPRQQDEKHLAMLRTMPCCCGCNRPAPSEAAHIRGNWLFADDKPDVGMQEKPDDKWTVPLNAWCHRDGPEAQHKGSEQAFWNRVGKDPFAIARRLWILSGGERRASQPHAPKVKHVKPRKAVSLRKRVSQPGQTIPGRKFDGTPIPARTR